MLSSFIGEKINLLPQKSTWAHGWKKIGRWVKETREGNLYKKMYKKKDSSTK